MKAAFFDFDDTLTHGDTLPLWISALRGWPWTITAYAVAGFIGWCIPAPGVSDWRGRIKGLLLRLTVRGIPEEKAAMAGKLMLTKVKWRSETIDMLHQHHDHGTRIVVVTGAATIYFPALLKGLPVDEILGTELEIQAGCLTGSITGVNSVRAAKAARVKDWIEKNQPDETWGYGNSPHDLQMLNLVDHPTIIT